jgi:hypothetical protein
MSMGFLNNNYILYAGFIQSIIRGTADILEENEQGIFLRDTVSGAFMVATENTEQGIQWLKKHEELNYNLLVLFQSDLVDFARKRYELTSMLDCSQAVYEKKEPPELKKNIQIQVATDEDYKIIADNYELLSGQELKKIIRRRELFIGLYKQEIVGFIGQHLEGSMGLLKILLIHRGNDYGTELESYLIAHILKKGLIPFCQIESDNYKSLNLQKKLKLRISDEHVYWLF